MDAVALGVADLELGDGISNVAPRSASRGELTAVHDPRYIAELERFCSSGGGSIDADTYATADTWHLAREAAGAGLALVEAMTEPGAVGLAAIRPPGHHAGAAGAMGFCLLNNVAIAAGALLAAGERVAIIDWDVHHGNGTQEIFWEEPRVLYVSTHQSPWYPGTGAAGEVGIGAARGTTLNVPVPAGATGDVLQMAFEDVVAPAVERFSPTWVLVSAGFDAHRDDPLALLELSAGDFANLSRAVREMAGPVAPIALFTEGGYDLGALRHSVTAALGALLGVEVAAEASTAGGPGRAQVQEIQRSWRDL